MTEGRCKKMLVGGLLKVLRRVQKDGDTKTRLKGKGVTQETEQEKFKVK